MNRSVPNAITGMSLAMSQGRRRGSIYVIECYIIPFILARHRDPPMTISVQDIERRLDAAAVVCRQNNVRFTGLRREILSLILAADRPIGAYDLLDRLKETHQKAAPPTIYRALEFLRRQSFIHRVEVLNAFIACSNEGHHAHQVPFLICTVCGAVGELQDPAIMTAIQKAAGRQGFRPFAATVEVAGTCARCTPV